jgi:hypothetical protein
VVENIEGISIVLPMIWLDLDRVSSASSHRRRFALIGTLKEVPLERLRAVTDCDWNKVLARNDTSFNAVGGQSSLVSVREILANQNDARWIPPIALMD